MGIRKLVIPALLFILVFGIYLHNASRGVYGGDVGDLVTASFVGGVAHPPGYPLFTLLGFLLTRLPFFATPALAVGFISVIAGCLGVVFFYLTVKELTKHIFISILASLLLAFSYFFWFYSEIAEVFILNVFFLILSFYLSIVIIQRKKYMLFPLFFFILGLSLTNHQTIVLTIPSLIFLYIPIIKKWWKKKKLSKGLISKSILCFLLGFSLYIYVPLASSHHPVINWDNVKDIPSFLHLLLRQDYGTFSGGIYAIPSFLQRIILIKIYLTYTLLQVTIPACVICILGVIVAIRKKLWFALACIVGFLITGPLFIGYAGFPLTGNFYFGINERFFILSTIFLLYFFPFGLVGLSEIFQRFTRVSSLLLQSIFLLIPLMLLFYNFPKTNLSHVFIGDTYAADMLVPLPPKSILFLNGDTTIFNAWYTHYVRGVRPDIRLLNINASVGSPYYSILKKIYLKKHPHESSQQVIDGVMSTLPRDGSVFSIQELEFSDKKTYAWIPYGLVLQLLSNDRIPPEENFTKTTSDIWSHMHIPTKQYPSLAFGNVTIADIPNSYANAMLITANFYLSQYQDTKKAKEWYDHARSIAPEYDKTYSSLAVWYLTQKNCSATITNLQKAMQLNPLEPINYALAYSTYADCLKDKKKAEVITKQFEKQFQVSFFRAFSSLHKTK